MYTVGVNGMRLFLEADAVLLECPPPVSRFVHAAPPRHLEHPTTASVPAVVGFSASMPAALAAAPQPAAVAVKVALPVVMVVSVALPA